MPTETVYGLAADAANPQAVAKVFAAKRRPASHPLIVHITDPKDMSKWAKDIPEPAYKLASHFWPGPLTLVLKRQPHVDDAITAGQETIALRIPHHPIALALIAAFGGGLVAPSANRFTRISPTTANAVRDELGDEVDLILDGGSCEVGLESTILDLSTEQPCILRPGMISANEIAAVIGVTVAEQRQDTPVTTRAPGMHHLHYAPRTLTRLLPSSELQQTLAALPPADLPVACLVWSDVVLPELSECHYVKMPADANAYAHDLYDVLRQVDQQQYRCIFIEAMADVETWHAILDRLQKASAKE